MPRRDFLSSLILLTLGIFVVVESLRMPQMEASGYGPYAAPGVVPGIVGAALSFTAVLLLVRAARAGGWKLRADPVLNLTGIRAALLNLGVALGLVLVYTVGLVGRIPFWLATFLFVFSFISFFEWQRPVPPVRRVRHLGTAFAQALLVAAAVTLLFERLFLIHLPG